MNIKIQKEENSSRKGITSHKPLFEADQQFQFKQQKVDQQKLPNTSNEEIVMKTKSKQFNFECGVIMGRIDIDINNKFGLQWHFNNTQSLEDFIKSVTNYVSISKNIVTQTDIDNLTKQYQKGIKNTHVK